MEERRVEYPLMEWVDASGLTSVGKRRIRVPLDGEKFIKNKNKKGEGEKMGQIQDNRGKSWEMGK